MNYFKIEDQEYCLSWRYYTGKDLPALLYVAETTAAIGNQLSVLQEAIFNFFAQNRSTDYWLEDRDVAKVQKLDGGRIFYNYFEDTVLFTECNVSKVFVGETSEGITRTYETVASAVSRRSAGDAHIKKIARTISVKRLLDDPHVNKVLKTKIAEIVFKS